MIKEMDIPACIEKYQIFYEKIAFVIINDLK